MQQVKCVVFRVELIARSRSIGNSGNSAKIHAALLSKPPFINEAAGNETKSIRGKHSLTENMAVGANPERMSVCFTGQD